MQEQAAGDKIFSFYNFVNTDSKVSIVLFFFHY